MNLRTARHSPEHMALLSAGQKAARRRIAAGEGFMYIAAVEGTDVVKVGFSLRPERRVKGLGHRFRLLGAFACSIKAERQLHAALAGHRHPGFDKQEIYPRSIFVAPQADPGSPDLTADQREFAEKAQREAKARAIDMARYQTDPLWARQLVERAED